MSFENIENQFPSVLKSKNPPSQETLVLVGDLLHFRFPKELREYLLKCGFLALSPIELNGINELQKEKSDMVRATLNFQEIFPAVKERYVVLEDRGDGDYILCDESDGMYRYIPSLQKFPVPLEMKLFEYIQRRFSEVVSK